MTSVLVLAPANLPDKKVKEWLALYIRLEGFTRFANPSQALNIVSHFQAALVHWDGEETAAVIASLREAGLKTAVCTSDVTPTKDVGVPVFSIATLAQASVDKSHPELGPAFQAWVSQR